MAVIPTMKNKEIPFKQWRHEEAERIGVSPEAMYYLIRRGDYPRLKMRQINKRVIFIKITS
jgi:hypothetical protein